MGILENMMGAVKDRASISKATIQPSSKSLPLRLAVIRATNHDPTSPPPTRHLTALLSFGHGASRAAASPVIEELMLRLHSTRSSAVALKCLLALHAIIRRGSFILHDQLSVFPASGGRNYLNLASFRRDGSSAASWELSAWVRWYAKYLEQILSASRVLGFFLFSASCRMEREKAAENIPSLLNVDLLREVVTLIGVLEEIARSPEKLNLDKDSELVKEVVRLIEVDYSIAVSDLTIRIGEFSQRRSCLSFADSVELVCALKKAEESEGPLSAMFPKPLRPEGDSAVLWKLARELREEIVASNGGSGGKGEDNAAAAWSWERRLDPKGSNSARFEDRVLKLGDGADSVAFSSSRFSFQRNHTFPGKP